MQKYTPDPFVFAVILSFLSFILGIYMTESSATDILNYWGNGFWTLIQFTLQMVMILVGGYSVATAPIADKFIKRLCRWPKSKFQAILFVTLGSCIASYLSWALGLIVGGLLALEVAKNDSKVSFRLLVASSYSGFIVWHGGISGSIPLLLNTEGNFSQKWLGHTVPLSQTIFSSSNLIILSAVVSCLVCVNFLLLKTNTTAEEKSTQTEKFNTVSLVKIEANSDSDKFINSEYSAADKLSAHPLLPLSIGALGLSFIFFQIYQNQFSLDLNSMSFLFIFIGLILHYRLPSFLKSIESGATKAAPILIQYPFYAGIMGILTGSGLAEIISQNFVQISSPTTFPFFTFISAGVLNFFIPSGGGQWAVQGPIVIPAAQLIGANINHSILAVAWGDAWTNLIQPFWALPLLAIAGLKVKDIMGYCLINLIATGVVISTLLLVL